MNDALLLVDLIQRFDHRDGDRLLASARERLPAMLAARDRARSAGIPVIYEIDFKVTILRDACATIDEEIERLSLVYAERVVGAFVRPTEDWQPGEV